MSNRAPMLKSGRAKDGGIKGIHNAGCSCCNTKAERRKGKRPAKRAEEREWRRADER